MDVVAAIRLYVNEMIRSVGPGMKVLLMDSETIGIISNVYAQSEIMLKEIYLFERIESSASAREPIRYLKCIVFLRPTAENVELLQKELRNPKYAQYYIYFSNVISKSDVKLLAEADEQEVVREVQEMYADFVAIHHHVFSLSLNLNYINARISREHLKRCTQGLASICLALKKSPLIRFQASSDNAYGLAQEIAKQITKEDTLFSFSRRSEFQPLLLILDRQNDALTPLLNQWTYQAMVNELLTMKNNRVNLEHVPGISKDMREVVLNPLQDDFYAKNLYSNFAEIGQSIKELMEEFQRKAQTHKRLESVADMKEFVEQYPQFRKMSGFVAKHVTVISELSRQVTERNLMKVSEIEQQLACHDEHSASLQEVDRLMKSDRINDIDAIRLVMLYALRYETHSNSGIKGLTVALHTRGVNERNLRAVENVLKYGGANKRKSDLFGQANNAAAITRKIIKGLKGVENVYTQHKPYVVEILDEISKGKLSLDLFPVVQNMNVSSSRHQEIIIFMVGGLTYEEALAVNNFNKANAYLNCKVIIGGTCMHTTKSFIEEIARCVEASSQSSMKKPTRQSTLM